MKIETWTFAILVPFFAVVAGVYAWWSNGEPVGTTALLLLVGLAGMIGFYLWLVGRRIDARPEDDAYGEIEQGAGEQGVFAPWSWWPLVLGVASAVGFLSLAVGWWLMPMAAAIAVIGLVGWVLEFSRGHHAH